MFAPVPASISADRFRRRRRRERDHNRDRFNSLLRVAPLRLADSKLPGNSDMRTPPLKIKILLESNPQRSRTLVRSLALPPETSTPSTAAIAIREALHTSPSRP